jgi:hypothetical protein
MRALLSLSMIVGLSAVLAIALIRMACFATEECFLFMHTRRFNFTRTLMSQFTGYRGIFSKGPLTRFEKSVLAVTLHPTAASPPLMMHWNRSQCSCARPYGNRDLPAERRRIEKCWHRDDRRTGRLAPP